MKDHKDKDTDHYIATIRLNSLIPEYLPIYGKKARIYYHGIPKLCNNCYQLGHLKVICQNETKTWKQYIETLKNSGVPESFFGSWINKSGQVVHQTTPSQSPAPGVQNSTVPNANNQQIQQLTQELAELKKSFVTPNHRGNPTRGQYTRSRG